MITPRRAHLRYTAHTPLHTRAAHCTTAHRTFTPLPALAATYAHTCTHALLHLRAHTAAAHTAPTAPHARTACRTCCTALLHFTAAFAACRTALVYAAYRTACTRTCVYHAPRLHRYRLPFRFTTPRIRSTFSWPNTLPRITRRLDHCHYVTFFSSRIPMLPPRRLTAVPTASNLLPHLRQHLRLRHYNIRRNAHTRRTCWRRHTAYAAGERRPLRNARARCASPKQRYCGYLFGYRAHAPSYRYWFTTCTRHYHIASLLARRSPPSRRLRAATTIPVLSAVPYLLRANMCVAVYNAS